MIVSFCHVCILHGCVPHLYAMDSYKEISTIREKGEYGGLIAYFSDCASNYNPSPVLVAIDISDFLWSLGIIDNKPGKISSRRKLSMMKEGLTVPKESKAVMTDDAVPFREPKSCEKPPIPMLLSLIWEGRGHEWECRETEWKGCTSHNSSGPWYKPGEVQ